LVEALDIHGGQFSMTELYEMYSGALNYCIMRINQGSQKFLEEYHKLYKILIEKEIIFSASPTGEISPWSFKNAILIALRLGNYEWSEDFIKNYQNKLPNDQRESAVSYNLALVYFYQKKYDRATQLLQKVEYEDINYNLDSKSMLLSMYYEQDEDEALISLMDSFKTYLYRHKDIAENRRMLYLNMMKYIRKLLKLNPGDKKEIAHIRKEMEDDRKVGIASEKWLLEKLVELE
jgi:tetratricopeptide (TPR) repeat protein